MNYKILQIVVDTRAQRCDNEYGLVECEVKFALTYTKSKLQNSKVKVRVEPLYLI